MDQPALFGTSAVRKERLVPQRKAKTFRSRWDPTDPSNHDVHTWIHTAGVGIVVRQVDPSEEYPLGSVLLIINTSKNSLVMPLTNYREDEIRAIAYGIYKAFELALPMCVAGDIDSKRRYDEGEEFQLRLYRSVPAVLSVEGDEQGDDEGISKRPPPVALEYRGPIRRLRVRRSRSNVAHLPPGWLEGEDDQPEDHDNS
jgi:hypothetical protein